MTNKRLAEGAGSEVRIYWSWTPGVGSFEERWCYVGCSYQWSSQVCFNWVVSTVARTFVLFWELKTDDPPYDLLPKVDDINPAFPITTKIP